MVLLKVKRGDVTTRIEFFLRRGKLQHDFTFLVVKTEEKNYRPESVKTLFRV